jgi:hypothetical protein
MPVFKRDALVFRNLDEGDPSGGAPSSSNTASGSRSAGYPRLAHGPRHRARDCTSWAQIVARA